MSLKYCILLGFFFFFFVLICWSMLIWFCPCFLLIVWSVFFVFHWSWSLLTLIPNVILVLLLVIFSLFVATFLFFLFAGTACYFPNLKIWIFYVIYLLDCILFLFGCTNWEIYCGYIIVKQSKQYRNFYVWVLFDHKVHVATPGLFLHKEYFLGFVLLAWTCNLKRWRQQVKI